MITDAWVGYGGLEPDYTHKVIDHAEAYVRGNVHTNEGSRISGRA
jgi:hypothetical protein